MKKIISLLTGLGLALNAFACLNIYYDTDLQGHLHEVDESSIRYATGFNKKKLHEQLTQLKVGLDTAPSMELLSDYAVTLLKLGKTGESLALLQSLQQAHPKEYKLASNLGTAYELSGELDSALKYIRLGMQLNPNTHGGSEWVHLAVLETKKKLQDDPNFLTDHTVLELDSKQESDTNTRKQIRIQLQERIPFMPNKDAIMASLVEDLGDCLANTSSIELAKAHYELAIQYYGAKRRDLRPKLNAVLRQRQARQRKHGTDGPMKHSEAAKAEIKEKYGHDHQPMNIEGIPFEELLIRVDHADLDLNFEPALLDVSELLGKLNLKPIAVTKDKAVKGQQETEEKETLIEPLNDGEKDPVWMYAFIVIAAAGIGYAIYRSRKRKP